MDHGPRTDHPETITAPPLSAEARQRIEAIIARYPTKESAVMPCLWAVQEDIGWVTPEAIDHLVAVLETSHARVNEILTFYTMFRDEPQARYVLQVCRNISCHLLGARELIAHLEKRLGIRLGEATPDGMFAIEGAECLGACGHGPMLQLGKHFYEYLTPEKADALLERLRKDDVPRADTDRELEEDA